MILDQCHAPAFRGYAKPLEKLEKSLRKAGHPLRFRAFVAPRDLKMVEITYRDINERDIVCIEGDSPAQAVKEVAKVAGL